MPINPFESFSPVLDADTLLDIAFGKSTSKSPSIPKFANSIMKAKRKEVNRIQNVNGYLLKRIKQIIQSVPNLDEIHPFYQELSHLLVNKDFLRKNLGKLNGLIPVLNKLASDTIRKINYSETPNHCAIARRQYFGRTSSIFKKQVETFKFLESARLKLKKIPTIDTTLPSIVVAGYPNVGKSSLVSYISSARPEICEYPFTTKRIIIGVHMSESLGIKLFQMIDTPGILDRPMNQRNEIEKQSILAMRAISNIVVFVFDPTMSCGYSIDSQISLFNEIKSEFIDVIKVPYIILLNKIDIASPEEMLTVKEKLGLKDLNYVETNAKDGTNINVLIEKITEIIKMEGLFSLDFSHLR